MQTQFKTAGATSCPQMTRTNLSGRLSQPVALDQGLTPAAAILNFRISRDVDDFPYDAIVAEFH